jgi:serine protease Do
MRTEHKGCSILVVLLAASVGCERDPPEVTHKDCPAPVATEASHAAVLLPGGRSIADVAEQVTPSVVSVLSEKTASSEVARLYPDQVAPGHTLREYNLGSGVIVGSDGVIVTNSHVVLGAEAIMVALKDGRTLEAELIGADPPSDLAVIRVHATNLPTIAFADSAKLRIGDVVLAIGNPFGIGQTVTMGIVSAVGRANIGITDYDDFIQTDAAINPGNSGGALVNMDGEVVGINTAIITRTGGYQGIGFAIPSRMAIPIKDSLLAHGKMVRGWLGAGFEDLTDEQASSRDIAPRSGVLVSDVTPESPAAKSGLKPGDLITAIDGIKPTDSGQARNQIAMAAKGAEVHVDVRADGKTRSITVRLGEEPAGTRHASPPPG